MNAFNIINHIQYGIKKVYPSKIIIVRSET